MGDRRVYRDNEIKRHHDGRRIQKRLSVCIEAIAKIIELAPEGSRFNFLCWLPLLQAKEPNTGNGGQGGEGFKRR